MPAKSPEETVDSFVSDLRRVAGCLTGRPLIGTGYRLSPATHYVAFVPETEPVTLHDERRTRRITFSARYDYVVDEARPDDAGQGFRVRETSYRFHIADRDGREILAYHWHPEGVSPVTEPHLHLSGRLQPLDGGERDAPVALGRMHLPTGDVTLAEVVRLLITEFGIQPRGEDWEVVLGRGARPD